MRNDARPTGEEMRDVANDASRERDVEREARRPTDSSESKPFVTDHDPGDEENPGDEKNPSTQKSIGGKKK